MRTMLWFLAVLLSTISIAFGQPRIETRLISELDLPSAKGGRANGTMSLDGQQVFLATKAGLKVFDTSELSRSSFVKKGKGVLHSWTDSQTGGLFVVEGDIPKDANGKDKKYIVGFEGKLMYFHREEDWKQYKPDWVIDRRFGIVSPQWIPSLSAHAILETNHIAGGDDEVRSSCTVVNLRGKQIGSCEFPGRPIGVDFPMTDRRRELHIYYMTKSGDSMRVIARPLVQNGSPRLFSVSNINLKELYGNEKQIIRPFAVSAPILSTGEGTRKLRFRGYKDGDVHNFAAGLPNALPQLHRFTPLTTSTGVVGFFESRSNFLAEFYPGRLRSRSGIVQIQRKPNQPHSIIDVVETEDEILLTTRGYIGGETFGCFLTRVDMRQNRENYSR